MKHLLLELQFRFYHKNCYAEITSHVFLIVLRHPQSTIPPENSKTRKLTIPGTYAQRLHLNLVPRVRPDALAVLVEEPRQRAHCQRHESQQGVAPPQPKRRIQATTCERKQGSDQRSHGRRRSSGAGLVVRVCVDEVRRNAHLIYKLVVLQDAQLQSTQHLRYNETTLTERTFRPIPMNAVPRIGTIQCMRACADQPYQNRPMGMKKHAGISGGRRYSGFMTPSRVSFFSSLSDTAPATPSPVREPMPIPRYARPTIPWEKPYWYWKIRVMVVKRRYRYP